MREDHYNIWCFRGALTMGRRHVDLAQAVRDWLSHLGVGTLWVEPGPP